MHGKDPSFLECWPRAILRVATILVLAAIGLAGCHPSSGDGPGTWKAGAAAANKAAETFLAVSAGAGRPPRRTDPGIAKLLDQVFNVPVHRDTSPSASFESIQDWLHASLLVGAVYLRAGLEPRDTDNPDAPPMLLRSKSILIYGPEVGRYLDAELRLVNELDNAVSENERLKRGKITPEEQLTRSQVTDETVQLLTNVLEAMALRGVTDQWRSGRVGALQLVARNSAPLLLSPQQRCLVRDAAKKAQNATESQTLKHQLVDFTFWFLDPVKG